MASVVSAVTPFSIALSSAQTSNTFTLSGVNLNTTILLTQGAVSANGATAHFEESDVGITFNQSTGVITATRAVAATAETVYGTAITFSSGVNSIQTGTISVPSGSTTATTTLGTSVGANAFPILLGAYPGSNTALSSPLVAAAVTLDTSTGVVTANIGVSPSEAVTVCYMVADLGGAIVASAQAVAFTWGSGTTGTATLGSSVTPADTLLIWNGCPGVTSSYTQKSLNATAQLTNSTTVSFTRNTATSSNNPTVYLTAVEFQSGVLTANAVQRGTVSTSASTSGTATLSGSVNTSYAFANMVGFEGGGTAPSDWVSLVLTNGTTVTTSSNAASTQTASYEVIEFNPPSGGSVTPTWRRQRSYIGR